MFRGVAEINKKVNVDREEKEAQGLMSLLVRGQRDEEPANGLIQKKTRGMWYPRSQVKELLQR